MLGRLLGVASFVVLLGACGATPSGQGPEPSFGGTPFQTVTSSKGLLRVDVRWSPAVPVRGEDSAQLVFTDELGNGIDGLSVAVVPWMPAHGHGTSVQPIAASTDPGVVVATPIYLYMSGEWQLRMTMTGPLDDTAIATVQIP